MCLLGVPPPVVDQGFPLPSIRAPLFEEIAVFCGKIHMDDAFGFLRTGGRSTHVASRPLLVFPSLEAGVSRVVLSVAEGFESALSSLSLQSFFHGDLLFGGSHCKAYFFHTYP